MTLVQEVWFVFTSSGLYLPAVDLTESLRSEFDFLIGVGLLFNTSHTNFN